MLSNFGWWELLYKKTNINRYFLPALTIAAQYFALFLGGLWNLLLVTAILLYLSGIAFAVCAVSKRKNDALTPYVQIGFICLAVEMLLALLVLRGKTFAWQDSYTHWGLVVRNLLNTDGFPNFADEMITFQDYPLGMAGYIYYFCRFISSREDMMMFGQLYVMLAMILPVFSLLQKQKVLGSMLIPLMTAFLLGYNIPITELLVDTVLGIVGAATIFFVYKMCKPDGSIVQYLAAAPMLLFAAQIKSSGMFFVAVAAGILVVREVRNRKRSTNRQKCATLIVALTPLIGMLLWERHCGYVFENAAYAKHAVSAEWFAMMLSEKATSDVMKIALGTVTYMITRKEFWGLLALTAGLGALCWWAKKNWKDYGMALLWGFALYGLYTIGLMGMFAFSMPKQAALRLECIDRYAATVDVTIYYLVLCAMTWLLSQIAVSKKRIIAGLGAAALVLTLWKVERNFANPWMLGEPNSVRVQAQELIDEYGIQKGYRYLLCVRSNQYDMPYFIWKYLMDTPDIMQVVVVDEKQMKKEEEADYVVCFDEGNPVIEKWVQENYPNQAGKCVIQCFK